MSNNSKVSIIVPIYNSEKYLKECIESILSQTYKNLEILLVDNNSKDNSYKICEEYIKKDSRIILLKENQKGVAHARNKAIENASGDYVFFIDADDYIEKDFMEKILSEAIENNADMVISGYTTKLKNSATLNCYKDGNVYNKKDFLKVFQGLSNKNLINVQCNKLTKANIVKKYRINENYISGEDYLFNLDLLKDCNTIKVSQNCGYVYRDNTNGVSNRIKTNYTPHYELTNMMEMQKIEEEKLLDLGFTEKDIEEFIGRKAFSLINKILRNIAYSQLPKKIKKEKYRQLLENTELKKKIDKKNINSNKDKVVFLIYNANSTILLSTYAELLKIKSKKG